MIEPTSGIGPPTSSRSYPVGGLLELVPFMKASLFPYSDDFFIGIGDINGAFLPKQKESNLPASLTKKSTSSSGSTSPSATSAISTPSATGPVIPAAVPSNDGIPLAAAISEQNDILDHQVHEKPLAKMQEEKSALLHHLQDEKFKSATSRAPSQASSRAASVASDVPSVENEAAAEKRRSKISEAKAVSPAPAPAVVPTIATGHEPNGTGSSKFVVKRKVDEDGSESDSEDTDSEGSDKDNENSPSKPISATKELKSFEAFRSARTLVSSSPFLAPPKSVPPAAAGPPPRADFASETAPSVEIQQGNSTDMQGMGSDETHGEDMAATASHSSQIDQLEEAVLQNHDIELHRVHKVRWPVLGDVVIIKYA